MTPTRRIAIEVLSLFEELLAEKGIQIPDADREGLPEEGCLFGGTYYALEDSVTDLLHDKILGLVDRALETDNEVDL